MLFFTIVSYSQSNSTSFIDKYNQLYLTNPANAMSFCDELILAKEAEKRTFGYAGKAYVHALQSDFDLADASFQKAMQQLEFVAKEKAEIECYILYFQSLRYLESQELETAIRILHKAINTCTGSCSPLLEIKLQSALGRLYSLSDKLFKAIEIKKLCLQKIKEVPTYSTDYQLKKEYLRQLVSLAFTYNSVHIFHVAEENYNVYIDSAQQYTTLAEKYAEKNQISNYNANLIILNSDINFYRHNYKVAKEYAEKALEYYQNRNRKKRTAQLLFVIAECNYLLKNWDQAEATFVKQIENNTWTEYQLLDFEALCYYYLFKIYEQKQQPKKALEYANTYAQKIEAHLKTKNASDVSIKDIVAHKKRKEEIDTYLQENASQKTQKYVYLYLLLGAVAILGTFMVYFFRAKRNTKKNIGLLHSRIVQLQEDLSKQNTTKVTHSLSDENAFKLIEKLKKLEKEELFLQPNYTLALAAKKLNTNSTYLSQTVNNYLNVTFAEYSNKLRIHTIVQRLKEQKNLRNYTIEALAKEAGYKSIGSFNTNFKKLLKVTPSQYLKELKRNY
ncbi:helix-turn-helix domain-containing protein [Kordia jejudonensis]|uniref:helix-turn-helix domain-containing protein n=1 Tax=Kordia jejudonensis TaxID=1348245 RepID=UPI0012E04468|nr:helix-turn-helix domain-containing protein [Kordia jejudonensis]